MVKPDRARPSRSGVRTNGVAGESLMSSPGQTTTMRRRSFRWRFEYDTDLPPTLVEAMWSDPDHVLESGSIFRAGDRSTIAAVTLAGVDGILKRSHTRGLGHAVRHALQRSRARRSWEYARRVAHAGLLTPRPLAILEARRGPWRRVSYLMTERIHSGVALHKWVAEHSGPSGAIEGIARQFGCVWRILGEARLTHGDMKAANLLVDPSGMIWLVDLDGMRHHSTSLGWSRARERDRRRFLRNWQEFPAVMSTFQNHLDRD